MFETALIVGWIICGIVSYGLLVAHAQRTFTLTAHMHEVDDRLLAFLVSIAGPIALITCFITGSYKKGWML
jgi:hypothetical protein